MGEDMYNIYISDKRRLFKRQNIPTNQQEKDNSEVQKTCANTSQKKNFK